MNILIDIGNSRLKWACEHQGNLSKQTALPHQQFNEQLQFLQDWHSQLLQDWQCLPYPKKLLISSVATSELSLAVITLAKQLWSHVEIVIVKSTAVAFGVKNAYQYPEKLGVDRWLCLIAAHHFYRQATWIVDCGTAITIDFIDADGVHQGGLIAPGLTLMKKALLQNTAALNFINQSYPLELADFTEAGIFSGTLYAAIGLIEQALKTQAVSAVLLLTGGDAPLISSHLQSPFIIDSDLIFKGLSIFSRSDL